MRIPTFLLQQSVSVKPYAGDGAYGAVYGTPYTAKCRIEPKRQRVVDRQGAEVIAEAVAYFTPDTSLTVQSTVTWDGREYTVVEVRPVMGMSSVSHSVAVLR